MLTTKEKVIPENNEEKLKNVGNKHFLLFLLSFQPSKSKFQIFIQIYLSSAFAFNFDRPKNMSFGYELKTSY